MCLDSLPTPSERPTLRCAILPPALRRLRCIHSRSGPFPSSRCLSRAPRPPPKPGTREANELATAQRMTFRVKQQAKEIKELRGELEALQPRRESGAEILFSTRAYVHKFDNIRQSPIHGERYQSTEQDEQLAKSGGHPNGHRAPGARGKIDMQQLSTITQNRKAIRGKKALGGRSLAQRTFAGSAITALPGLNVTLAQKTKTTGQNRMKRHY